MAVLVTRRFRVHTAYQLLESFSEAANTKYYIFVGHPGEWPDEGAPPTPVDTVRETRYEPWRTMIAAKRITGTDVTLAADRYNWTTGTVYDEYDDTDTALQNKRFYVVTRTLDTFNVYKCLFNNRGAASTVEPTGTSTSIIATSDGYKWKFMYSISAADALKFVTSAYVPVKTLTSDDGSVQWDVQQAATNSAIDIIDVTANGSNYAFRANTLTAVTNATSMALDSGASEVDDAYAGGSLFIRSGLGSGQIANVISYNATTKVVSLSAGLAITPNTSSGYHVGPRVTVVGDCKVTPKAYANVSGGEVTHINMVESGTGFTKATVTISGASGSGATAVPRISPPGGHGSDPVGELDGTNVMMNVRVNGSEGNNFPTNNDFRIVGIIKDPLLANGSLATATAYDQTTKLTVSGINDGPFVQDEIITGTANGAIGRVVTFANTNGSGTAGILKLTDVYGTFETEQVTGNTSSAVGTITSIQSGELLPYFGDIMYKEYVQKTELSPDGIIDVKIIVRY